MRLIVTFITIVLLVVGLHPAIAQDSGQPFMMPVALPAGPATWLLGQPYGNTVGAFNFGTTWYSAGQGLHFGIDVSMPCGTPLVAVADGDVIYVDNMSFGAGPHNLILRHPDVGLTTLYGHLLDAPPVQQYQPVRQGEIVAYSGDPDVTCDSRPHLHFEVRSLDYRTAYNPVDYIDVNWHVLAAIGSFGQTTFQVDLTDPRRWVSLDNQPPVAFGGARLNSYTFTWPPPNNQRPPASAPVARETAPLPENSAWQLAPLGYDGCCPLFWWHPTDAGRLYTLDGSSGQIATITEWNMDNSALSTLIGQSPPPVLSPDGSHQIIYADGQASIRRLSDNAEWVVQTSGAVPAISADNSRLLWLIRYGESVPGARPPLVEVWVSDLDGQNARQVVVEEGIGARWLDSSRLLLSTSERTLTTLTIYDTNDSSSYELGTWDRVRGVSVAPGGGKLMFYRNFQADPNENGVYMMDTQPGAQPQKLPWFGGWRWRDGESVYYIPFDPVESVQTLAYYHVSTGEHLLLTDTLTSPFTIANGDWAVSASGQRIVFMNAADRRLWLLEGTG
jgi:hypothetical protein